MKPPSSTARWIPVGLGLVIVAGGAGAYAGSLGGPFIFDDMASAHLMAQQIREQLASLASEGTP